MEDMSRMIVVVETLNLRLALAMSIATLKRSRIYGKTILPYGLVTS